MRVLSEADGRSADRLAATPDGWAAATAYALTRWRGRADPEPGAPLMSAEAVRGPLHWLTKHEVLAWGPVPVARERPQWTVADLTAVALADVGEGAGRIFELATGALAPDARFAYACYRLRRSRVRGTAARTGESVRSAIVDMPSRRVVSTVPGPVPMATDWSSGALILGHPGRVDVRSAEGAWTEHELGDAGAVRSFAFAQGTVVAATATGHLVRVAPEGPRPGWSAHRGPVTALSAGRDPGTLLSGGADGWVRLWIDRTLRAELDLGRPVDALAGPVDSCVGALAGGAFLVLQIS